MRTQISGRQIDVGQALQSHVSGELGTMLGKYSQRPTDAQIVFSRAGHEYVCESEVHLSTGLSVQARASAGGIYAAFDACGEKMDKQLRRYKRRLKDHHRIRPGRVDGPEGAAYLDAADGEDALQAEDGPDGAGPVIVAEAASAAPRMSVGEAAGRLESEGLPALAFRREGQDGLHVVYRRVDGNIGWIDPGVPG